MVANPENSEEPGYDSFASASLSYGEEVGETLLCVMMEERLVEFGGEKFERLLESFLNLELWDFGFALSQPVAKKPEFHVLGLDGGFISAEDRRRLTAWYSSMPDERLTKLRDVYPYIIVNDRQLRACGLVGQSIEDVATLDTRLDLTQLGDSNLWIWKVKSSEVGRLRDELHRLGSLIT